MRDQLLLASVRGQKTISEAISTVAKAVLLAERCDPIHCQEGVCVAGKTCPIKAFWQDEPNTVPFLSGARCHGCSKCIVACPLKAIELV